MKAISLWQPWASLWCSPRKVHETRHWSTSHRGWLGVHAAKKFVRDVDGALREILEDEFGGHWGVDLPTGCIIGAVKLVACRFTETMPDGFEATDDYACGDFSPGRYAWERSARFLLRRPIPFRGWQGMWELPPAIAAELEADAKYIEDYVEESAA